MKKETVCICLSQIQNANLVCVLQFEYNIKWGFDTEEGSWK